MEKETHLGKKHRFAFVFYDDGGKRRLNKKRYYYSMTQDEYEELTEMTSSDGNYEPDSLYVMATYDGLVREAINKMAKLMVSDPKYRTERLEELNKARENMRASVNNKERKLRSNIAEEEEWLAGLEYCVPIVESFFQKPFADNEKADIIFNLTNVLYIINKKYWKLIWCWKWEDCEL